MNYSFKVEITTIVILIVTAVIAVFGAASDVGKEMLANHATAWRVYFWSSTVFVFVLFRRYPGKTDNLIGDLMVSFILAWMWWPLAIWYAVRIHRSRKGANLAAE